MYFNHHEASIHLHTDGIESGVLIDAARQRSRVRQFNGEEPLYTDEFIAHRRGQYPACKLIFLPQELHLVAGALEEFAQPNSVTDQQRAIALELAAKVRRAIEVQYEPLIEEFIVELNQLPTSDHPLASG
jgi:hypothetical protein